MVNASGHSSPLNLGHLLADWSPVLGASKAVSFSNALSRGWCVKTGAWVFHELHLLLIRTRLYRVCRMVAPRPAPPQVVVIDKALAQLIKDTTMMLSAPVSNSVDYERTNLPHRQASTPYCTCTVGCRIPSPRHPCNDTSSAILHLSRSVYGDGTVRPHSFAHYSATWSVRGPSKTHAPRGPSSSSTSLPMEASPRMTRRQRCASPQPACLTCAPHGKATQQTRRRPSRQRR